MELIVFIIAGALAIIGALGVVIRPNPVHSALSLVLCLFAMAVLFLAQDAQFLAAVQVIVYAGAIVVLFLFVIMLLGVDQAEDLSVEPIVGQRGVAAVIGFAVLALGIVFVAVIADDGSIAAPTVVEVEASTGLGSAAIGDRVDSVTNATVSATELLPDDQVDGTENNANIRQLGRVIFTDYVFAFEITALLLTIAVVGAVALARRPTGTVAPIPEAYDYEAEY